MATLFLSCSGFYEYEKNFDKILLLYIFSLILALKVMLNIKNESLTYKMRLGQSRFSRSPVVVLSSSLIFFFFSDIVNVVVVL